MNLYSLLTQQMVSSLWKQA